LALPESESIASLLVPQTNPISNLVFTVDGIETDAIARDPNESEILWAAGPF
jgi:hypothetical protein